MRRGIHVEHITELGNTVIPCWYLAFPSMDILTGANKRQPKKWITKQAEDGLNISPRLGGTPNRPCSKISDCLSLAVEDRSVSSQFGISPRPLSEVRLLSRSCHWLREWWCYCMHIGHGNDQTCSGTSHWKIWSNTGTGAMIYAYW
jgi:hypothetical protein